MVKLIPYCSLCLSEIECSSKDVHFAQYPNIHAHPHQRTSIILAIEHGSSWDQGTFSYTSIIMIVHEKITLNLQMKRFRRSAIKPECTRAKLNCCTLTDGISFSWYSYIPNIAPKPRAIECTSKQTQSDCIE